MALVVRNDSRAFKVESKPHFHKTLLAHGMAEPRLFGCVEHKKASTSGTDQFAAQRAVGHGKVVPYIDRLVGHFRAPALLVFPVNIHQSAEFRDVSPFESQLAADSKFLYEMEILRHFGIGEPAFVVLLFENRRRRS